MSEAKVAVITGAAGVNPSRSVSKPMDGRWLSLAEMLIG